MKKQSFTVVYVIGGVLLMLGAMMCIPYIIDTVSSFIYKRMRSRDNYIDDSNWGAEIVKRNKES